MSSFCPGNRGSKVVRRVTKKNPKGAVVAERSDLYYLQELTRSTSRGTRKDMSKCKVLRVCIPYGNASLELGEGPVRRCEVS